MSNITTDLQSFEDINYPKNIYELLLKLKNEPLQINCNSTSNSNTSGSYQKYNSEETLLRVDPVFGEIYTKTFFSELSCDFSLKVPQYFLVLEDLANLQIDNVIDYSATLSDERKVLVMREEVMVEIFVKQFVDLNNLIYLDSKNAFLQIPTNYDMNDVNEIVNVAVDSKIRNFKFYLTLVYTRNVL